MDFKQTSNATVRQPNTAKFMSDSTRKANNLGNRKKNLLGPCQKNPDSDSLYKKWYVKPDLPPELEQQIRDPEQLLQQSRLLKNSNGSTVGVFTVAGQKLFLKRSNCSQLTKRLRRLGQRSRAEQALAASRRIADLGIRVPEVYLTLSTYPLLLPGASYLITEYFPEPVTLADQLNQVLNQIELKTLIRELAAIAGTLHQHGIIHGDLKFQNWLVLPDSTRECGFCFGLIDFDGISLKHYPRSIRKRRKELARMASSCYLEIVQCQRNSPDIAELLQLWCDAYLEFGKIDFHDDSKLLNKVLRMIRRKLPQESVTGQVQ